MENRRREGQQNAPRTKTKKRPKLASGACSVQKALLLRQKCIVVPRFLHFRSNDGMTDPKRPKLWKTDAGKVSKTPHEQRQKNAQNWRRARALFKRLSCSGKNALL